MFLGCSLGWVVERLVEIAMQKETQGLKRELVSLILDMMNLRCLQYIQVGNMKVINVHCRKFRIHVFSG